MNSLLPLWICCGCLMDSYNHMFKTKSLLTSFVKAGTQFSFHKGVAHIWFKLQNTAALSCRKTSPTLHTVDTFLGMLLLSKIISCVSKWFLPALFLSIFERKSENWQANASLFCLSGSTQNLFWKIFKLFFTDRKFQIKGSKNW